MEKVNDRQTNRNDSYAPWNEDDATYHGAAEVVARELEYIKCKRTRANIRVESTDDLTGIALSGGGIRSASFALGILQALAYHGWLKRIDYLSTVSGGGYIGSALTWLLHKQWTVREDKSKPDRSYLSSAINLLRRKNEKARNDDKETQISFGLGRDMFPFDTYPFWGNVPEVQTDEALKQRKRKGALLRFLRQHAKYLMPGHGINTSSMLAAVLRSTILSLAVYVSILALAFEGLIAIGAFGELSNKASTRNDTWSDLDWPPMMYAAGGAILVFLAFGVFNYVLSGWYSLIRGPQVAAVRGAFVQTIKEKTESSIYRARRSIDKNSGRLLNLAMILTLLGSIAVAAALVSRVDEWTGALFSVLGASTSVMAFAKTNRDDLIPIPLSLLVVLGTGLLWLGVLILAYSLAVRFDNLYLYPWAAGIVLLGLLANLNYISIHRYYRDRLMETFLPDVDEAVRATGTRPDAFPEADQARLSEMIPCEDLPDECDLAPYHIVNTNLVLAESRRPKFEGRGGDNFVLAPLYCGSNATGWRQTRDYMGNGMTLATAMAISGAAVNPSAACGGDGVTRHPFLSSLMGLLNIRLGYWAHNPGQPPPRGFRKPNFIWPGIFEVLIRHKLSEESRWIELSDGGHFENLGLYELIRRRLKIIIVSDGGADPEYAFSDLANAIEKVRVDFGTLIRLRVGDVQVLEPYQDRSESKEQFMRFADSGFFKADIDYPGDDTGKLIYLSTTFFKALSADLYGYRKANPAFPDQPTSDQFFDEKQFEAYRELGYQALHQMWEDSEIRQDPDILRVFREAVDY